MDINLIGVPLKYGCDKDGMDKGPDRLRAEGIMDLLIDQGHKAYDMGNIYVPYLPPINKYLDHHELKYLNTVEIVNTNLANNVYCTLKSNKFPFIIGGDHSLAMGTIAGASRYKKNLAVIWISANSAINTSVTSNAGNISEVSLAASMNIANPLLNNIYFKGQKVEPQNVYHIGIRDISPDEVDMAKSLALEFYDMDKLSDLGLENVIDKVISEIRNSDLDGIHLSFNINTMDPALVVSDPSKPSKGFNMDEVENMFSKLLKEKLITSMDFVGFNPEIDHKDMRTSKTCMKILNHIFKKL